MIGEHPELYGFPELQICVGQTVEDALIRAAKGGHFAPPGLIRFLAQEHHGIQNQTTVMKAVAWIRERKHWSTKKLFDYILELVDPQMGVEKSPVNASHYANLNYIQSWFPKAYYLHLTRHPVAARSSIKEHLERKKRGDIKPFRSAKKMADSFLIWYDMHRRIVSFTDRLSPGQYMRIKGEDLLSEPDKYLPQIAEWLGLSTDKAAIEAMKHPERSPYAYVGPPMARGGNDNKFMRNPSLRTGTVREPRLENYIGDDTWSWGTSELKQTLTEAGIECAPDQEIADEIRLLAHLLGYR